MTNEQEAELERMNVSMAKMRLQDRECDVLGAKLAKPIIKFASSISPFRTMAASRVIAVMLDHVLECEPDHECQDLLLGWIREHYWGLVVRRHLEMFDRIHAGLVEGKYTRKKPLVYGDIDCGAWFEPCENRNVVVLEVYCSCANDNIWIYMRPTDSRIQEKFHCRTCYPKSNKRRWPAEVSLTLHRREKFKLGYGDCRDSGYVFSYDRMTPWLKNDPDEPDDNAAKCDRADDKKIYWGLWNMRGIALALENADG